MTTKDATDESHEIHHEADRIWITAQKVGMKHREAIEVALKRGQALERARVCQELRELQSSLRARVVDVYKGQGHHDAGMRDGLTLAANRMDDLLNEIEAA